MNASVNITRSKCAKSVEQIEGDRKQSLVVGQRLQLLSTSWYEALKKYVAGDDAQPGPLTNADLFAADGVNLRPGLQENEDYIMVSEGTWRVLFMTFPVTSSSKYKQQSAGSSSINSSINSSYVGGGSGSGSGSGSGTNARHRSIAVNVITNPTDGQPMAEIYPCRFHLVELVDLAHAPVQGRVDSLFVNRSSYAASNTSATQSTIVAVSKYEPLSALLNMIRNRLGRESAKMRLWRVSSKFGLDPESVSRRQTEEANGSCAPTVMTEIPKRLDLGSVVRNYEMVTMDDETVTLQQLGLDYEPVLGVEVADDNGDGDGGWPSDKVTSDVGDIAPKKKLPILVHSSSSPNIADTAVTGSKLDHLSPKYSELRPSSAAAGNVASAPRSYLSSPLSERQQNQPGVCGLQNLGNTCFMNSALQCLSNVSLLTEYMQSNSYKHEINYDNPLGHKGRVANAYGEVISGLWSGSNSSIVPRHFKSTIGEVASQFLGYQQQDAQELLAFLLDGLHEDLNRVKNKPYIETPDYDGSKSDKEVAGESWDNYIARDNSIIVDLFSGQYRSTLTCPKCDKLSVKFDPFTYLTLPIPVGPQMVSVNVHFVRYAPPLIGSESLQHSLTQDPSTTDASILTAPIKVALKLPKDSTASKLTETLAETVNNALSKLPGKPQPPVDPSRLIAVEISDNTFDKIISRSDNIPTASSYSKVYVYELPIRVPSALTALERYSSYSSSFSMFEESTNATSDDEPEDGSDERIVLLVHHVVSEPPARAFSRYSVSVSVAAPPSLVVLRRSELTPDGLIHGILAQLQRYTSVDLATAISKMTTMPSQTETVAEPDTSAADDAMELTQSGSVDSNGPAETNTPDMVDDLFGDDPVDVPTIKSAEPLQPKKSIPPSPLYERSKLFFETEIAMSGSSLNPKPHVKLCSKYDLDNLKGIDSVVTDDGLLGLETGINIVCTWKDTAADALLALSRDSSSVTGDGNAMQIDYDEKNMQNEVAMYWTRQLALDRVSGTLTVESADGHTATTSSSSSSYNGMYSSRYRLSYDSYDADNESRKPVSIYQCLEEFQRPEKLSKNDEWYCGNCKEHVQATKKMDLWKLPEILIVHLKRFSQKRYLREKLDVPVNFPLEGLDIAPYLTGSEPGSSSSSSSNTESTVYNLFAISNHFGGLGGGHYTAHAKNSRDGHWYNFDDSRASRFSDTESLTSSSAYILFYARDHSSSTPPDASDTVVTDEAQPHTVIDRVKSLIAKYKELDPPKPPVEELPRPYNSRFGRTIASTQLLTKRTSSPSPLVSPVLSDSPLSPTLPKMNPTFGLSPPGSPSSADLVLETDDIVMSSPKRPSPETEDMGMDPNSIVAAKRSRSSNTDDGNGEGEQEPADTANFDHFAPGSPNSVHSTNMSISSLVTIEEMDPVPIPAAALDTNEDGFVQVPSSPSSFEEEYRRGG